MPEDVEIGFEMPCLQGIQRCHYIDYKVKIVPVSNIPRRHLRASLQQLPLHQMGRCE